MSRKEKAVYKLRIHWGTSRARDTYGYNVVSLYVDDKLTARCNGGGYDMEGTVFGDWVAKAFVLQLRKLKSEFYGLTFHDPTFNHGAVVPSGENETVDELEKSGKSIGLERYQAFYSASSKVPTKKHVIPRLDGACGMSSMRSVFEAIGGRLEKVASSRNDSFYRATV